MPLVFCKAPPLLIGTGPVVHVGVFLIILGAICQISCRVAHHVLEVSALYYVSEPTANLARNPVIQIWPQI